MNNSESQCRDIINYIETHPEGITLFEAFLELNCSKLSTRVGEIIRSGYPGIIKIPEVRKYPNGKTKRFMRYRKAV